MEDVELNELVRKFQALQKDAVSDQITERNAVEIVNVLIKKKMVELLYTTDAKEYLTWDELRREVVEEVHASNGRLNMVDLPGLLSVHTYQVERVVPEALKEDPTLRLEGGELMTDSYLDTTVQAAADTLKESGSLSVTEFAARFQFTSAFALTLLKKAIQDGSLSAVIQDSALYTKQFVHTQRMILRAGLLAADQPVDVDALYKRHDLFHPLMDTLIEQLAAELPGSFQGHLYTPEVFESFRAEQVSNVYTSNGLVDYSVLQALGISNPRVYLERRFNPAASHTDGATAAPGVTASSTGGGRRNTRRRGGGKGAGAQGSLGTPAVPVVRADEEHPFCGYPLSTCFVSDRFLSGLAALQPLLDGDALAVAITQVLPAAVDVGRDWAVLTPRLLELYPALADCELVEETVLVRADAAEKVRPQLLEDLKKEADTKKKKSSGRKASAANATGKDDAATSPWADTVRKTIERVLKLPVGQNEAIVEEIMGQWNGMIEEVVQQVESAQRNSAFTELRQSRASLQDRLTSLWIELGIVAKGLQWAKLQLDDATYGSLCRSCLSSRGLELCRQVVLNESLDQPDLQAKVADAMATVSTPGNFKKCLAPFPEKAREVLTPLVDALNHKEVEHLMDELQEMCSGGTIAVSTFYPPNKKTEREANAKLKEDLVGHLAKAAFTSDVTANGSLFATLVAVAVSNCFRVFVEIPGKAVSVVVSRVAKEEGAPAGLTEGLDIITAALQKGSVEPDSVAALEQLRATVLATN